MPKDNSAYLNQEWLPALQAVHLLAPLVGGDRAAKKAIIERLKDGAIDTKAWWFAHGFDVGRPYVEPVLTFEWQDDETPPKISAAELLELRKEKTRPKVSETKMGDGFALRVNNVNFIGQFFWRAAEKKDIKRWDWAAGFFLATGLPVHLSNGQISPPNLPIRMFMLGAEFAKVDILKIVGTLPTPAKVEAVGAGRGRKLTDVWPAWVAEVVSLIHDEGFAIKSPTALVNEIANRLARKGIPEPAYNTVFPAAKAIVEALNKSSSAKNQD